MASKREKRQYVGYARVSTQRQGESGLGLEVQQEAITRYVKSVGGTLIEQFVEVETGKGRDALQKRPRLRSALEMCKKREAVLVIGKLDRLGRNVHFVSGLMESKVRFIACDLPEANELTLHIMAAFAQHEARMISERTKAALARAKARGVKIGRAGWRNLKNFNKKRTEAANAFASRLKNILEAFRARHLTQRQICEELNRIGVTAPKGGPWSLIQLQRTLARI
jgi:DNA invertase Pin-like site-specific DNA recombinase